MAGIDPALLRNKGPNQAYPGSAPNPVAASPAHAAAATGPAPMPPAEPVALHEAAQAACAHLDAARSAIEDLQQQAQLADGIDAPTEKAIDDAADQIAALDESFDKIEKTLGQARQEHEDAMSEFTDEDTPGPG